MTLIGFCCKDINNFKKFQGHSKPCQTSKIERIAKIDNGF